MNLAELKLTSLDISENHVEGAPDSLIGKPINEVKRVFDRLPKKIIERVNTLLGTLSSEAGAASVITASGATVQMHIDSKKNPHEVTKAQLGLSLVENTSDLQKPVSALTKQAIDTLSNNVLTRDNQTPYTPTGDYHPVTLKLLRDAQFNSGAVSSVFGRLGDINELDCGDWDIKK